MAASDGSNGNEAMEKTVSAEEGYQLERLGTELKCSICLSLLKQAASLTCNHSFCTSCILESLRRASCCPLCKLPTTRREVRPAPHMDNLVTIYKGMETAAGLNIYASQIVSAAQPSGPMVDKVNEIRNFDSGKDIMQTKVQAPSQSAAFQRTSRVSRKRQRQSKLADVLRDVTNKTECDKQGHKECTRKQQKKINKNSNFPVEGSLKGIIPAKKRIQVPQLASIQEANSGYAENLEDRVPKDDSKLDLEILGKQECKLSEETTTTLASFPQSNDPLFIMASAIAVGGKAFDKGSRPKLAPFFWLREIITEDDCTQEKPTPPTQTHSATCPTFSDLKDSDDECHRDEIEKGSVANKVQPSEYDSDIFAWSQQPCSPELICSPCKNQDTISPELHLSKSARYELSNQLEKTNEDMCMNFGDENFEFHDTTLLRAEGDDNTPNIFVDDFKGSVVYNQRSIEEESWRLTEARASSMRNKSTYAKAVLKDTRLTRKRSELLKSSTERIAETNSTHFKADITKVTDAENRQKEDMPASKNIGNNENSTLFVELSSDISKMPSICASGEVNGRALKVHDGMARGCKLTTERLICAFCRSFGNSKVAGLLLQFKDGALVPFSKNTATCGLKVHKLCAEWAPDVYFTDTKVHNLMAETVRGRKIKCSSCGQKGAALGCCIRRCRKSYHYPCAKALSTCKWDLENHVMLCPDHSKEKFPTQGKKQSKGATCNATVLAEKCEGPTSVNLKASYKSANKKLSTAEAQENLCFAPGQAQKWLSGSSQKWVLCGSALDTDKKVQLASFASVTGATLVKAWSPLITHVITSTDEQGTARRTLKYLMAILEGKWILKFDWMAACLDAGHAVDEEPFEVHSDIHGIMGGPRRGRDLAAVKAPKLFEGLNFYFSGQFQAAYKADLQALVQAGGGMVLHRKPIPKEPEYEMGGSLTEKSLKMGHTIVVYNVDLTLAAIDEENHSPNRLPDVEAKLIAEPAGACVLAHTWILDSAAGCRLQPMDG